MLQEIRAFFFFFFFLNVLQCYNGNFSQFESVFADNFFLVAGKQGHSLQPSCLLFASLYCTDSSCVTK
uniref:Putative secreted protein n=1 Tax=Ixodes ricinus TaxID=34613 RepID=A0A6B0TZA1_IXORI